MILPVSNQNTTSMEGEVEPYSNPLTERTEGSGRLYNRMFVSGDTQSVRLVDKA